MVRNINMLTVIFILSCISNIIWAGGLEDCVHQMVAKGLMKKLTEESYTDAEGWEEVAGRLRLGKTKVKSHVRSFLDQNSLNASHTPVQHCTNVGESVKEKRSNDPRFDPNDRRYTHY